MKSAKAAKPAKYDARTDPDVPAGMSIELLQDLHLLTREGQLNADARRKLKQIRHLVGLLRPALDDAMARTAEPLIVDCGAGKSYLGALLYELVLGPAGRGSLTAIEARPELSAQAAERAARFGQARFRVTTGAIADAPLAQRPNVVTALHACDTATDDALARAVGWEAALVLAAPCCHHDIQKQLKSVTPPAPYALMTRYGIVRERFADVLTDSLRAAVLRQVGYRVEVVQFVDSQHTPRNLLLRAARTGAKPAADLQAEYEALVTEWQVKPRLAQLLLPAETAAGAEVVS